MAVSEIQNPEKYTNLSAPKDTDTVAVMSHAHGQQPRRDRWGANIGRSISNRLSLSKTLNYSKDTVHVAACPTVPGGCICTHILGRLSRACIIGATHFVRSRSLVRSVPSLVHSSRCCAATMLDPCMAHGRRHGRPAHADVRESGSVTRRCRS